MSAYDSLSNDQQRRFVDLLLAGEGGKPMDAKAAYIGAGYKARGNAAEVNAHKLLRIAKVQAALAERRAEMKERANVTQDDFVRRLQVWMDTDRSEIAEWGFDPNLPMDQPQVRLTPSKDLSADALSLVEEVAQTRDGIRLKTVKRTTAADMLAKVAGLYDNQDVISVLLWYHETYDDAQPLLVFRKEGPEEALKGLISRLAEERDEAVAKLEELESE